MDLKLSEDIIKGIYLLILIILGGETASTFSQQGFKLLKNNYIAKHILIFCLIYFTIDYSSTKINHPNDTLFISILIWICYILISKQTLYFTIIIFCLITILYILFNYLTYYDDQYKKTNNKEIKDKYDKIKLFIKYLTYIMFCVAIIGFVIYFMKQKKLRKGNFRVSKFIFGHGVGLQLK